MYKALGYSKKTGKPKLYRWYGSVSSKTEANKQASSLRKKGLLARVIKVGKEYFVYGRQNNDSYDAF